VRDPDDGTARYTPDSRENRELMELFGRVREMSGGSPYYAANQRALLLRAGFSRAEAGADVVALGNVEETPTLAFILEGLVRVWSTGPDSFWALMLCHGVGWA
jgi:hypothetical protein